MVEVEVVVRVEAPDGIVVAGAVAVVVVVVVVVAVMGAVSDGIGGAMIWYAVGISVVALVFAWIDIYME